MASRIGLRQRPPVIPSGRAPAGQRVAIAVAVAIAIALAAPARADAHPFGPPPVARITSEGHELRIAWSAAEDDYAVLGGALGVLTSRETYVYDASGASVAGPPATSEQMLRLGASSELEDYVRSHVNVRQAGVRCPVVVDASRLAAKGADVRATCPSPVGEVDLELTLLQDLDPAFRTVGLVEGSGRTLFTSAEPVQVLDVGVAEPQQSAASGARLVAGGLLLGALALGGAVLGAIVLRARRRSPA